MRAISVASSCSVGRPVQLTRLTRAHQISRAKRIQRIAIGVAELAESHREIKNQDIEEQQSDRRESMQKNGQQQDCTNDRHHDAEPREHAFVRTSGIERAVDEAGVSTKCAKNRVGGRERTRLFDQQR